MADIKVGQIVYLCRRGIWAEAQECRVSSVGRKYFTLEGIPYTKFRLDTMRDESGVGYGYNYLVYLSRQDIRDEDERRKLWGEILNKFRESNSGTFSLEQLRKLREIIDGGVRDGK